MRAVVFTVAKRPYYMAEVLDSWRDVVGIEDWKFIFLVEPTRRRREQLALIKAFPHPNKKVIQNRRLLGCSLNTWTALEAGFASGANFVVMAEEDLVVSTDVLSYFDQCDRMFADDPDVLAICARGGDGSNDPSIVGKLPYFSVHVWGTWADRWNTLMRDDWDYDYSSGQATNTPGGWDWHINLRVRGNRNLTCVHPAASRSDHIGELEGLHLLPKDFPETQAPNFVRVRESSALLRLG